MPLQFTLQTLLLSAVVIWSSMAAFGPRGLLLAFWIVPAVGCVRVAESKGRVLAMVLAVTVVFVGLLFPVFTTPLGPSSRVACINNLHQINLGLLGYHQRHGSFPPAYLTDADGKPAHSWRVLILPQMGHTALYEKYDFSEPWNGPNNSKLADRIPSFYACPSTQYAVPAKPQAARAIRTRCV